MTGLGDRLVVGLLAHERPERVRAFIEALDSPSVQVIIHLDARSTLDPASFLPDGSSARLIDARIPTYWGSHNLVIAALALFRAALELPEQPSFVSLVSGSDWPTRAPDAILDRLVRGGNAGYLAAAPLPRAEWIDGGFSRLNRYHLMDLTGRGTWRVRRRVAQLSRRSLRGLPPLYGGSAWLDLRVDAVRCLVDALAEDAAIFRRFRNTLLPDEILFHTVLMSSPLRDRLMVREDHERNLYGLRYLDWSRPDGTGPAILDREGFRAACASDAIFTRKVLDPPGHEVSRSPRD